MALLNPPPPFPQTETPFRGRDVIGLSRASHNPCLLAYTFLSFYGFTLYAAGNFPIGLSSSGTPTSLQVVGPPGYDSTILSLMLAMEKLFGDFPGPPNPSLCAGCLSNVTVRAVSSLRAILVMLVCKLSHQNDCAGSKLKAC